MNDKKRIEDFTLTAFGEVLTNNDVVDFFREKSEHANCPVCGFDDRTAMLTGADDETSMVLTTRRAVKVDDSDLTTFKSTDGSRELPVFGLWCENCGNLQLHTVGTLATWKKARQAEAEGTANADE